MMRLTLLVWLVSASALALGAEPAPQPSSDDLLLKVLGELGGAVPAPTELPKVAPKSSTPGMSNPGMSSPGMSKPGMPAMSQPRPASSVPSGRGSAVHGVVPPVPARSLSVTKLPQPREDSDHWAFQPVQNPTVPANSDANWSRDDLDRFVLARLEKAGVRPNPDAPRATLLRRLCFDLTGLPPTEAQMDAFLSDRRSDDEALAALVDELLASSRFGERWGRHWLDVVRYADSVGRTWNAPFTYAWRYRDYVIDAFNNDTPYDEFILQQVAGDFLPADTTAHHRQNLTATGFLALGAMALTDGRYEGFQMDRIDEQIDVTSRAFLGLTISCARCHDHKYDPVSMQDYYALAGIFYSTQTLSGQGHLRDLGREGYVDASRLIQLPSEDRSESLSVVGVHSMDDFRLEWQRIRDDVRYTTHPHLAMGVVEGEEIRDCELRIKGEPYDLGAAPPRGDLRIPGLPGLPKISASESGRLQLARWIASPEHPLTARVMVNRVWRHLFGRGLLSTPDNFGINGGELTHPELLDHLATRFVQDGWSVKSLIREIVTSRTYRLSSAAQPAAQAIDTANELYWRHDLRRLELEAIRDSLLQVAGRLDDTRPYGIQVAGTGGKGRNGVVRSLLSVESGYRTVYLPVLRSELPSMYTTFDFPDPCQISGQREVTTIAPQALFFLNGELVSRCAEDATDRLLSDRDATDEELIVRLYRWGVSRTPEKDEVRAALDFMRSLDPPQTVRDEVFYRWSALVQAVLASGEFRYSL